MSDELMELSHHALTGGGAVGVMYGLVRWFGGRQVKQLDETLAKMQEAMADQNKNAAAVTVQLAVMNEQLKNLIAERVEITKMSERLAMLEQRLNQLELRKGK